MKLVLMFTFALLLLPALVGSAAASVAVALPAASIAPLAGVPEGGYPDAFPFGECTWWAAYNHRVTWSGDAKDWLANARAQAVRTSDVPSVGAIAVYRPGGAYSAYGHVAIVIAVEPTSYWVSDMHAPHWGVVSTRVIAWPDPNVQGFIAPEAH